MAAIAVIATMFTRGKGLPGDVVAQILALGGLHYCCDAVTTEVLQGSNNMDQLYLEVAIPTREQLRLPSGLELAECLEVMVDCCSHDQGWASLDQELNGTYRSSFTWSELEVTKQPLPEAMEEIVIPRTTASVNLRASRAFRWHRKIFDHNDPVVAKVTPGCKCRLYMRSQYPGWINSVNYGRIKVSFALEIEDTRESVA
ncbi:TPA: hypothetical protein N0F65_008245 [Lagenidium giganteum]|uniref:Uncharacterized protein n=1 Tax=Lagenidium giganteum TaxID=4803 RepID=A0AAV2YX15_9STRA|nr:TPA: hypothetical protein N0F65_008245 [Lagenidium giganteum]